MLSSFCPGMFFGFKDVLALGPNNLDKLSFDLNLNFTTREYGVKARGSLKLKS